MAQIITMPRLSDTMTEGVVATWLKKVGDTIKTGDILAEIETDKATMEFESFHDGVLLHIGIQEGQSAPVDSLLAIIGTAGEDISALISGGAAPKTEAPVEAKKEENNNITSKICLTYFITILYDEVNLDIYNLSVICVPNGNLYSIYGNDVYSAGKNPGKARFSFSKCSEFKMLPSNPKRIKIIKHLDVLQSNYTKMTQETYSRKMEWWNQFHNESKHGKNL